MDKKLSDKDMWEAITQTYLVTCNQEATPSKRKGDIKINVDLKTPKLIVEELDKTVIGQTKAKQLVAIAAWNRLLSMNNRELGRDEEEYYFEKNNILLIGNTGCGKTHLIKALADAVSLPVTIQDATSFTSAGYVGRDVDTCVENLVKSAEEVVKKNYNISDMTSEQKSKLTKRIAEFGIIYIDEVDKVRCSNGSGKDVNGRSVQEGFLKMIEGTEVTLRNYSSIGTIDTSNMLFIFGGAFSDLDKVIGQRLNANSVGFSAPMPTEEDKTNILERVNVTDFTMYGMIPELMGRLPTVAILKDLDRSMIYKIFTQPERCIMCQVINEFKSYGIEAAFTEEAIEYIVDKTLEVKLGARGLRSTCQQILRPLFFHLPSNIIDGPLVISKEMIDKFSEEDL